MFRNPPCDIYQLGYRDQLWLLKTKRNPLEGVGQLPELEEKHELCMTWPQNGSCAILGL